jgi:hypothetical protein
MALLSPLFFEISEQNESEQTAQVARLLLRDLLNERAGIVQANAFEVTERQAGANNSVDIAPGGLFIPGTEAGTQGFYYVTNETVFNLEMAEPAHATLPRIDSVVVHVNDAFFSGSVYEGLFEWVPGTADGSPVPPDLDGLGFENYWKLADIEVPGNDNVVVDDEISDTRTDSTLTPPQGYASAVGGIGVATSGTLNTLFPSPRESQHVWLEDTKVLMVWDSAANEWEVSAQQHEVPSGSAFRTGTQSIPSATPTILQLNSTNWDNDGVVNLAANRMVVQTPGLYTVQAVASRDGGQDAIPVVGLSIFLNGVQQPGGQSGASTALFGIELAVTRTFNLNAGDFVQSAIFHAGLGGNRVFRNRDLTITFLSRPPT